MTVARRFPIPSRLNALIIALQLAAVAACLLALRATESWYGLVALAAVFGVVMNSVYSTIHEAEHGILFRNRRANELAGTAMALLFPAPFHLIRQGHIGHHMRNRSDDEAFDCVVEGESKAVKVLQFYGIITGLYWATVALGNIVLLVLPPSVVKRALGFERASAALMDSLNPRYWMLIRLEALAAIALHASIILALGLSPLRYLVIYYGFGLSWSAMQYVHHFGTERHVVRGTRNLWIWRPLDAIWLNHNWHLNHHANPTVPWIHLPALAEREDEPAFLPWAYVRMWRGPRRSEEHVENRYAGRIID